jgi:hypothetical protein
MYSQHRNCDATISRCNRTDHYNTIVQYLNYYVICCLVKSHENRTESVVDRRKDLTYASFIAYPSNSRPELAEGHYVTCNNDDNSLPVIRMFNVQRSARQVVYSIGGV